MERRKFIKTACVAAAAISLPACLRTKQAKEKLPSFGLITGTIETWLRSNPREALQELARLGYTELEFSGNLGLEMNPKELKGYLKSLGLIPLIGDTSIYSIVNNEAEFNSDISECLALGQKYITCYWPWLDDGKNKKLDDWKRAAENLNKGGEICQKNGLQLLFHNHDQEFYPVEGQIPMNVLIQNLDPSVGIELDLYWAAKSGQSVEEFVQKYPGRFPVYHVKDMPAHVVRGTFVEHSKIAANDFACVGSGNLDFASLFKLNKTAGVKHFIVEHDRPENPRECVTTSARFLSALRF